MVNLVADRVLETSTTTGTSDFTLSGALTGYRTFSSAFSNSDVVEYAAVAVNLAGNPTGDWEVGYGALNTGTGVIARTTIRASSNSGSKVTFGSGTKYIYANASAALIQLLSYQNGLHIDLSDATTDGAFGGLTADTTAGGVVWQAVDNSAFKKVGTKTKYIPADLWNVTSVTDPASAGTNTAGSLAVRRKLFNNTQKLHCQYQFVFPKSWDGGVINWKAYGMVTGGGSGDIILGLEAVAASHSDDLSALSFGTAVEQTLTTTSTANDLLVTGISGDLTIGGSPADYDEIFLQFYRDGADAADTSAEWFSLIGVDIYYTDDAQTDA